MDFKRSSLVMVAQVLVLCIEVCGCAATIYESACDVEAESMVREVSLYSCRIMRMKYLKL